MPLPAPGQHRELQRARELNTSVIQLYRQGKYQEAIPYAKEVVAIRERVLGPHHEKVAAALNNLALLYTTAGDPKKGALLYRRSLEIKERVFGPKHPEVALVLNNLAELYAAMGKYTNAERFYHRALTIDENFYGPYNRTVALDLHNLASLYHTMGFYGRSEILFKKALAIREREFGPDHPQVAQSLNNLAVLYKAMGIRNKVEELHRRALSIWEKKLGPEHPYVARSLNNLALFYLETGEYERCEPLFRRALAIDKKVYGDSHPVFAAGLNNLALLSQTLGSYGNAEKLYKRGLAIYEKALPAGHPEIAGSLANLGTLHYIFREYGKAKPLYTRALEIDRRNFGEDHPFVASHIDNLAKLYHSTGDFARAENLYLKALDIKRKVLGKDHDSVASSLNNLAEIYREYGHYDKAEPHYRRAVEILRKRFGPNHQDLADILGNQALNRAAQGRYHETLRLLKKMAAITDRQVRRVLGFGSEKEKLAFLFTVSGQMDGLLSLIASHLPNHPDALFAGMNMVLARKGLTLEAHSRYKRAIFSGNPGAAAKFQALSEVKAQLIKLAFGAPGSSTPEAFRTRLANLEAKRERLEGSLSRLSAKFALEETVGRAGLESVARAMPERSVLVELARSNIFDFKAKRAKKRWRPARYLAFILHAKRPGSVKMVDLGDAEGIDRLVTVFKSAVREKSPEAYSLAGELHARVFSPIKQLLGESDYIFISPDGRLSMLPFGVLVDERGKHLIESYTFNYLSTGRDILRFGSKRASRRPALILADPDFDFTGKSSAYSKDRSLRSRDLSGFNFKPLPETRLEAQRVDRLLTKRMEVKTLLGGDAQERELARNPRPGVLHLATHGFFLTDNDYRAIEDSRAITVKEMPGPRLSGLETPMLRSGLALAGANLGIRDSTDQGLVCAEKITTLDFEGTDLVVLSACETGIGEVKISEGVFGLSRAFILAGAKTLVMSMWSVPDRETRELMVAFYSDYLNGVPKIHALRNAALKQMKRTPHPYYWGAFVGFGDPL